MAPVCLGKITRFVQFSLLAAAFILFSGCEENAATGQKRFTGLMPMSQESSIGAGEHAKVLKSYGGVYPDTKLQAYVNEVGQRVAAQGERQDVKYTFTLLNSSVINAFAIPGGYIYVTRGLLAAASSEAELAAVLAHETGHITARHSAQRYSTAAVTSLGTTILGAVLESPTLSKALNQGAGLWLQSYSRDQEHEADNLGMRYLVAAGYDPAAMPSFLYTLQQLDQLETAESGNRPPPEFLSTHPLTGNRVAATRTLASNAGPNDRVINRDRHLDLINGMTYGDAADAGFIRNGTFYHPEIGFAYKVPDGFKTQNQPEQVVSQGPNNSLLVFDMVDSSADPAAFITDVWLDGKANGAAERTSVNGMNAATIGFNDTLNGKPVSVRLMAIAFSSGNMARFQVIMPTSPSPSLVTALQESTYSFRKLTDKDKAGMSPERIRIVTANAGDTANSLSRQFPTEAYRQERFRALNGISATQEPKAGQRYKVVSTF